VSFSPEDRLILLCSRGAPGPRAMDAACELLHGRLDWDYVLESSVRHGVAPLFSHGLAAIASSRRGARIPPARVTAELRALTDASRRRNERLYGVLGDVVEVLEQHGVQALALKDIQLAVSTYPDRGLRPIGDVDLLIRRGDYAATARSLRVLGFEPLPSADVPYTLRYALAQHFRRARDEVWIDVQWGIMQREWDAIGEGRPRFDIAWMWSQATPQRIQAAGRRYSLLTPSLEHMLFHLCDHLEGHAYGELVLFCDVAELLQRHGAQIDWRAFVELARAARAASTCYHVLLLAQQLLDAPVPARVLASLESDSFPAPVFTAFYGGLTSLHLSLDDIRRAVGPPPELLRHLEHVVRSETATAMRAYDEVEDLAAEVSQHAGSPVMLAGTAAPRRFPDALVPAFGDARLVVLDSERSAARRALERRGYAHEGNGALVRHLRVESRDPAVGAPIEMTLEAVLVDDVRPLLERSDEDDSNRNAALGTIRARLDREQAARDGRVRIEVATLGAEDILTWLLADLGARDHRILFGLPPVLDFLRRLPSPVHGPTLVVRARELGVADALARGVGLVEQILPADASLSSIREALGGTLPEPRALQWARIGPSAVERHPGMRDLYLLVLCLVSARDARERLRVLVTSRGGLRSPLVGIVAGLARSASRRHREQPSLAYWLEEPRDV
jgi:hypothetical protein